MVDQGIVHKEAVTRAFKKGVLAILAILGFNILVLSILQFPEMALLQIKKYWFLLIVLIGGFGFQMGLYTYLKFRNMICSATTMASSGVSSVSMILCCSHYLVPLLPFLSATFAFVTVYTPYILLFGIFSNFIGSLFLLKKAEVHFSEKARWWAFFVVVFLILFIVSSVFAQYTGHDNKNGTDNNDQDQKAALQDDDLCEAPEGYTQEEWNEHMSHHPEQYKGCLNMELRT